MKFLKSYNFYELSPGNFAITKIILKENLVKNVCLFSSSMFLD
jgi:hypothetical protein